MRFSEKSFEIRFCSALTAGLQPYNRNPKWFGLTQSQERQAGIDTMIKMGGRLFIFQFKASKFGNAITPSFKVESDQCNTLSNFTRNHPNSVFYVFPSQSSVRQANRSQCLIKDTHMVSVNKIAKFFNGNTKKSRTLHLIPEKREIYSTFTSHTETTATACKTFGCVCDFTVPFCYQLGKDGKLVTLSGALPIGNLAQGKPNLGTLGQPTGGIRIGVDEKLDTAIRSAEQFERIMFGEEFSKDLRSGLYGHFVPND